MIRPFTVVCMLMAVGSGLYLYQCKHQAQVLDRKIASTIKETDQARNRISMLRAEWAQLNEPERVADLARAHTTLQTAKPTQFMALNDLAAKLPAVVAPTRQPQPTDATDDPEAAPAVAQAEPRPPRVAAAAPEPKPEAKPDAKPVAHTAADPKPNRPAVATPAPAAPPPAAAPQVASVHPVARPLAPAHAPAASAVPVNTEATAPGTVGAAVLRAMRARDAQQTPYVQPIAAPAPTYAPPPRAPAPTYAPPAVAPSYTPQAYAAPVAGSMLGGTRTSLPPPVPFAAR